MRDIFAVNGKIWNWFSFIPRLKALEGLGFDLL
jgi:hypothetical protein